jgi:restriction system protein
MGYGKATMSIPDVQSLIFPVLSTIAADREISSEDLRRRIAVELQLTENDLAEMLSGGVQTVFTNRASWAIVSLQNSGLIEKAGKKRYRITDAGLQRVRESPAWGPSEFLGRSTDPVAGQVRFAGNEPAIQRQPAFTAPNITPEEQIEKSYTELSTTLASGLLERVREMPPRFFEYLTIELLIKLGYGGGDLANGEAVGRSGDGGIDGVIKEDALGLDRIYVQAKRYAGGNTVGRPEVQAFVGSLEMRHANKGIFITTSSFSPGAQEVVHRVTKQIILIDGIEFARLMIERSVGVRTVRTYDLKTIDENYFEESSLT